MKRNVLDSVTALEAWIVVDLRCDVDVITGQVDVLKQSATEQEATLNTASDLIRDIDGHNIALKQAAETYKTELDETRKEDSEEKARVAQQLAVLRLHNMS
jgi:hypothetical protein